MELTIESAFSTGGMVGHLSYLLLVISMMMRSMTRLRILVILSSLVAITYDAVWLKDPVGVFWETLLVTVNIVQLALIWHARYAIRFNEEEATLVNGRLSGLDAIDARRLLRSGFWANGDIGTRLTTKGQSPTHLAFLTQGRVRIESDGQHLADCLPGNFVGEMSLIDGSTASADAYVSEPARYWMIAVEKLDALKRSHPEVTAALESGISRDLKAKLTAQSTSALAGSSNI